MQIILAIWYRGKSILTRGRKKTTPASPREHSSFVPVGFSVNQTGWTPFKVLALVLKSSSEDDPHASLFNYLFKVGSIFNLRNSLSLLFHGHAANSPLCDHLIKGIIPSAL